MPTCAAWASPRRRCSSLPKRYEPLPRVGEPQPGPASVWDGGPGRGRGVKSVPYHGYPSVHPLSSPSIHPGRSWLFGWFWGDGARTAALPISRRTPVPCLGRRRAKTMRNSSWGKPRGLGWPLHPHPPPAPPQGHQPGSAQPQDFLSMFRFFLLDETPSFPVLIRTRNKPLCYNHPPLLLHPRQERGQDPLLPALPRMPHLQTH